MLRRGFTLVELIVVIIVIIVLIALILPMQRNTGGTSRRMQCGNNVKQLVLGLQNYHDTFLVMPHGARQRTTPAGDEVSFGTSWLVAILPFCEQRQLYDRLYNADLAARTNDYLSAALRLEARNAKIKYLLCPASPLPEMEQANGFALVLPSYAGIMGANEVSFPKSTVAFDQFKRLVAGPYAGTAAGNGMLPINEWLTIAADCKDGTANTIVVGEVSDWYYDDRGNKQNPALAVVNPQLRSFPGGWLAGTDLDFKVEKGGQAIPADRVFNLITLEHPVGTNNRGGKKDTHPNWGGSGIGGCGLNNPLLSAHPAGAMVGFVDGHVQLLTKQTSPHIIKQLAIRDDGAEIPDF